MTADDRDAPETKPGDPARQAARPSQPILNAPKVIGLLVAAIIGVAVVRYFLPHASDAWVVNFFAFDSSVYTDPLTRGDKPLSVFLGPVTHMLLHDGPAHLLINMAMLLAFGAAIGRRMGAAWFLALFVLCTIAGAAAWFVAHPTSPALVIGASGGVSGLIGAIARLGLARRPMPGGPPPFRDRKTGVIFAVLWVLLNLVFGIIGGGLFGIEADIAWEAHLGGFFAGLALMGWFDGRGRADTRGG